MSLAYESRGQRSELASVWAVDIRCDDCGRTKRLQGRALSGLVANGTHSIVGLHNKLFCSVCRDRGGLGKNVSLSPIVRSAK